MAAPAAADRPAEPPARTSTRWILLSAAAVVSVLCVVIGWHAMGPPADPRTVDCSSSWACTGPDSLYVVASGLLGFGCGVLLLLLTLVGEAILMWRGRRICG
ncbi:hypothetical protein [Streptomyces collinus]|uniref:hypothetical protein n=1 Tax=Streptomyces collinus TaxID=42684 RepID=UPI0037D8052C